MFIAYHVKINLRFKQHILIHENTDDSFTLSTRASQQIVNNCIRKELHCNKKITVYKNIFNNVYIFRYYFYINFILIINKILY